MINGAAVVCAALTALATPHREAPLNRNADIIQVAADDPVTVQFSPAAGPAGSAISLNLKIPLDGVRFAILRDIPDQVTFSHGFRMRKSWIVAAADLDKLQVQVSPAFAGPLILDAYFHRIQGSTAARGVLVVSLKGDEVPSNLRRPETQHPTQSVVGTLSNQERPVNGTPKSAGVSSNEEQEELERGRKLVGGGDIATARLIFQNLAFRGSAPAARHLGETYDPEVLKRLPVAGLRPDPETARKWYQIAADAGDDQAAKRLNSLAR